MEDVLEYLVEHPTTKAALASLVWSSGSIPMSERAKMLVLADGKIEGTIGGGCLEAEIVASGRQVIDKGVAQETRYTMTEQRAGESGLNCGGTVRIYTEPLGVSAVVDMYGRVVEARRQRRPCCLVTLLEGDGAKMFFDGSTSIGTMGKPAWDMEARTRAAETLAKGEAGVWELADDSREIFVEPFLPPPRLYVFGGGHVGGQICRLAASVGFEVEIIDDRPAFAKAQRHPQAKRCRVVEMEQAFAHLPVDGQTFIVAATRGHQHDEIVVEQAIKTPAAYVGMLGSERKKMVLWQRMRQRGAEQEQLDRVAAPIGFNIGADTPEEIAVSVVAELIHRRRKPTKIWKTKQDLVGVEADINPEFSAR
jgi:xanthine dehydrogenase accessory factor